MRPHSTSHIVLPTSHYPGQTHAPALDGVQRNIPTGAGSATHSDGARLRWPEEGDDERKLQARDGQHAKTPPPVTESSAPTGKPTCSNTERGTFVLPIPESREVTCKGPEPLDRISSTGCGRFPPT